VSLVLIRFPRTLPISIVKKRVSCAIAPVFLRSSCQTVLFESLKPLRLTKPTRAANSTALEQARKIEREIRVWKRATIR
jgi:hypothetical protein